MKPLRTLIYWLHLLTGLSVGIVVLIMSVTGVLLTYEKQMTRWAGRRSFRIAAGGGRGPTGGTPRDSLVAAHF